MKIKRRRITGGILAVLTAVVVACGSANAGSQVQERAGGGGSAYITADAQHGVGLQDRGATGLGAAGHLGSAADGPQFQP